MTVQFELWQLVLLQLSFFGAVATASKVLFSQLTKSLDHQFAQQGKRLDAMEATHKQDGSEWQRLERDLLNFKADLPLHYVRREDYVRGQAVLEAKQDALYSKVDVILMQMTAAASSKGAKNG